jgi:hypothetical protein
MLFLKLFTAMSFPFVKSLAAYVLGDSKTRHGNNNLRKPVTIHLNGFDIENSDITCQSITVKIPNEDGINITSSRVNIVDSLTINMTINETFDRDIFDLETDDRPAFIRIEQNCLVKIDSIFGDQLTLISDDLPQPVITPDGKELTYNFNGYTVKGQSYVYSGFFSL